MYYCYFRTNPDRAIAHVRFEGEQTEDIQRRLASVIMNGARDVMVEGRHRKMIGTLLVTPADGTGKIDVVPIPLNPEIDPTPSEKGRSIGLIIVKVHF